MTCYDLISFYQAETQKCPGVRVLIWDIVILCLCFCQSLEYQSNQFLLGLPWYLHFVVDSRDEITGSGVRAEGGVAEGHRRARCRLAAVRADSDVGLDRGPTWGCLVLLLGGTVK